MREIIDQILNEAINAPSGSNSQPWKFEVSENKIVVIAEPEKDHPIFNYRNRGTLVAHGALIENIKIVAHAHAFETNIEIFPNGENSNIIARVTLNKSNSASDTNLALAIPRRSTNRKEYKNRSLQESERMLLRSEADKILGVSAIFTESYEDKKSIGKSASVNEVVMFKNKTLHNLFFKEILWDAAAAQQGQSGLYIKTMELAKPQEKAIKLLGYWPIMKIANLIGLTKKIAEDNARSYSNCSAMVGFIVNDGDKEFIEAGRALERVWLAATSLGLSAHMLTGVLFMYQQIIGGNPSIFSRDEQELIKNAYRTQAAIFNADKRHVALILRIGEGEKPSAMSTKKKPVISFAK